MPPLSRLVPLLLSFVAACSFKVNYDNAAYSCTDGLCPDGYSCVDEVCLTTAALGLVDGGTEALESNVDASDISSDASQTASDASVASTDASVASPDAQPPQPVADAAPPAPDAVPPEPGSCDALFNTAVGYQLCSDEADRCSFNAKTAGGNCNAICASFAATCLNAFDNNDAAPCAPIEATGDTCETNRQSEICVCTR